MSMYAVKNDVGSWLAVDGMDDFWCDFPDTFSKNEAKRQVQIHDAHVVELVEAPAKVVVSEEEAKMLKKAKDTTVWRPAAVISKYAYNAAKDSDQEVLLEDRLMRAYVIGWTVEKPKRYVLPMPGTYYHNYRMHGNAQYYAVKGTGNWRPDAIALDTDDAVKHGYTVTQSDIDATPDWVKAITPMEVTDDEQ
ncbi:DUF1642 domain-containing protein [Lacticaseibacillus hegangensis]|uniref:DUF1642 domain-containing protein n=1 Tax=Lacticaseibacillus hegangensis TaxID=2486010 RepID=A0ABW4CV09_9LACO|nr:DUF1642 domain-containing protein [Lacticaseibacillus hegangensis]